MLPSIHILGEVQQTSGSWISQAILILIGGIATGGLGKVLIDYYRSRKERTDSVEDRLYDQLVTRIGQLEDRVAALEAQVESERVQKHQYRNQLQVMSTERDDLEKKNQDLMAENVSLREILKSKGIAVPPVG